jgi:multidrug resistance protein
VVGYQGPEDKMNPHNWSKIRKIAVTMLVAWIGFIVGFASSIDSAVIQEAMKDFGVSEIAESLATGLYLVGFGFGAFFAGPISETVGRNPVYLATLSLFMVFVMASGLAKTIGQQLVFRLLAGFFGSTPLTCAGGSISDMWNAEQRTIAFPVFANAAFWGPILGPVVGGYIGQSSLIGWRWTEWITLIWSGVIMAGIVLFLPETYGPILLRWKATHLRKIPGDDRFVSEVEIRRRCSCTACCTISTDLLSCSRLSQSSCSSHCI